jgi:hypothetical protein
MRGIRAAWVGTAVAVSAASALGQPPGPDAAPAARFGTIRGLDPAAAIVARGHSGGPTPMAPPADAGAAPAGVLGQPRPYTGPSVTVVPGAPTPGFSPGSAVPVGYPVPAAVPSAVGGPVVPSVLPLQPAGMPVPELEAPLYGGALGLLAGPNRFQFHADMLLWFIRSGSTPPLLTTSSPQFNGIIGQGDTRVIYGGEALTDTFHTGGRFGGTYWFTDRQCWGLDGNVFFLGRNGNQFTASTATYPLLARPFFNLNQGTPFSEVIAEPGLASGAVTIDGTTSLWGAEINLRRYLCHNPCARLDGFVGFRYLGLSEDLSIDEYFARTPGSPTTIGVPNVASGFVTDQFRTENHFYGPQFGLDGEFRRGRWFFGARSSVALGVTTQSAEINGGQIVQYTNGTSATFPGGLYALSGANMGTYTRNRFGVVPEVGVKIGYHFTPNLRLAVGYNFLYLNDVLRPGDPIDPGLDVTRIPNFPVPGNPQRLPVPRPAPLLKESDIFVQGISFSLQWKW